MATIVLTSVDNLAGAPTTEAYTAESAFSEFPDDISSSTGSYHDDYVLADSYDTSLDTTSIEFTGTFSGLDAGDAPADSSTSSQWDTGGTSYTDLPTADVTIDGVTTTGWYIVLDQQSTTWFGDDNEELNSPGGSGTAQDFEISAVMGRDPDTGEWQVLGYISIGLTIEEATELAPGANADPGQDPTTGAYTATSVEQSVYTVECFTRGTMIRTQNGEVLVENLKAGDMVLTRDHGLKAIRWIGSQTVAATGNLAPIMFKAGSIGNKTDLRVSPQHRMVIDGSKAEILFSEEEVFVLAKHLVNGDTIYVDNGGFVEYFHMMFDTHEVVFANGAATESFQPGQQNMNKFANETREEIFELFPELRKDISEFGEAARYTLSKHEARVLSI